MAAYFIKSHRFNKKFETRNDLVPKGHSSF
jgi:hypothetical protein